LTDIISQKAKKKLFIRQYAQVIALWKKGDSLRVKGYESVDGFGDLTLETADLSIFFLLLPRYPSARKEFAFFQSRIT